MYKELVQFIEDKFKINYTPFFTKENLYQYVLLCRDNLNFDKSRTLDNKIYYRYGFHIYLFGFKMNQDDKKFIKTQFSFSKELKQVLNESYPAS